MACICLCAVDMDTFREEWQLKVMLVQVCHHLLIFDVPFGQKRSRNKKLTKNYNYSGGLLIL